MISGANEHFRWGFVYETDTIIPNYGVQKKLKGRFRHDFSSKVGDDNGINLNIKSYAENLAHDMAHTEKLRVTITNSCSINRVSLSAPNPMIRLLQNISEQFNRSLDKFTSWECFR